MRDLDGPSRDSANLEAMGEARAYQAAIQCLVEHSLDLDADGACILDFGAGRGDYAAAMQRQRRGQLLCLEPDRALHQYYPAGLPVLAGLEQLRAQVDAVYSLNVLEHIKDDVGALRTLVRHCLPGAPVFLLVPANQKLWTTMDTLVGHHRRYSPAQLRACVQDAGLVLVDEGWFDRTGYFATRAYKVLHKLGLHRRDAAGAISKRQVRIFDMVFRTVEPFLSRMPFGKNYWVLARTPN